MAGSLRCLVHAVSKRQARSSKNGVTRTALAIAWPTLGATRSSRNAKRANPGCRQDDVGSCYIFTSNKPISSMSQSCYGRTPTDQGCATC